MGATLPGCACRAESQDGCERSRNADKRSIGACWRNGRALGRRIFTPHPRRDFAQARSGVSRVGGRSFPHCHLSRAATKGKELRAAGGAAAGEALSIDQPRRSFSGGPSNRCFIKRDSVWIRHAGNIRCRWAGRSRSGREKLRRQSRRRHGVWGSFPGKPAASWCRDAVGMGGRWLQFRQARATELSSTR